jgi:hypothetical protein
MSYYNPPLEVGEYTTSTVLSGDLKKTYRLNAGVFRWVTNSAAITNAGGKVLAHSFATTTGLMTGTVIETATATDYRVAGVIPLGTSGQGGAILATTTLAANSYFLLQLNGEGKVQANTTVTAGAALITTTTAGFAGSMGSGVEAAAAVAGYFGYATNTAVATVAGGLITCVLTGVA